MIVYLEYFCDSWSLTSVTFLVNGCLRCGDFRIFGTNYLAPLAQGLIVYLLLSPLCAVKRGLGVSNLSSSYDFPPSKNPSIATCDDKRQYDNQKEQRTWTAKLPTTLPNNKEQNEQHGKSKYPLYQSSG
jgi:hypothetical protein